MKLRAPLAIALLIGSLHAYTLAWAEGERGEQNAVSQPEEDRGGSAFHGGGRPSLAPRPAPPRFAPHPPGVHPHGPIVRPHPVRVLAPRVIVYGAHEWRHWEHPEFARPVYYWEWSNIHQVTCIAEDSYGDQYPVTEATFRGFGLINMTAVEDDALDRCYVESGNDPSCYLATCSHY